AAVFGAAATFWKFTTDADSYILANILLVLTWLVIRRSPVRAAYLHLGAMLMHQLAALFYPVGLVLLWRHHRERYWRNAAIYTLISAGGVLAAYALAYGLAPRERTAANLTGWLTFHANIPFSFNILSDTRWLLLGTARLFGGGKLTPSAYFVGPIALIL